MAPKLLGFALIATAAASPLSATRLPPGTPAPPGGPDTLYCMRVGPITGSLLERVECWTRDKWADEDVNVDEEWAENGVGVQEPLGPVQHP